jgi:hypothetical protein
MQFTPRFYRFAAVCSVISAVTTLMLIFLPRFFAPVEGFEARMGRVHDPAYQVRAWAYLLHPFVTVTAALAVAMRLRKHCASLVIPGFLGFALWGATEAAQQTLTLFAFDRWREAWLAGDAAMRATMELRTALYDDLWNALYFLLMLGFLAGCTLYGIAMWHRGRLARTLSVLYGGASGLTILLLLGELGVPSFLPPWLDAWIYPAIQPLARTLIGVWLWQHANESAELPSGALSSLPAPGPR